MADTITWKNVDSVSTPGNAQLLIGGANAVSEGLGGAGDFIKEIGSIYDMQQKRADAALEKEKLLAKQDDINARDKQAFQYIREQKAAEAKLTDFLAQAKANPALKPNAIGTDKKLNFINPNDFVKDRLADFGLKDIKDAKKDLSPERFAEFQNILNNFSASFGQKDKLQQDFDALRQNLHSGPTIQNELYAMYADSPWTNPMEVEERVAKFSSPFAGAVDRTAIDRDAAYRKQEANLDTEYALQQATMDQELLKQEKAKLTTDFSGAMEATKGRSLYEITSNLFEDINKGKYAPFADTFKGVALYSAQDDTREWESGKAEELAKSGETAISVIKNRLETAKKATKDPEVLRQINTKLAILDKGKNALWIDTLTSQPLEENIVGGGMELEKHFGFFGENDEKINAHFTDAIDKRLNDYWLNEKTREDYEKQIKDKEDEKHRARLKQGAEHSKVDSAADYQAYIGNMRNIAGR